MPAAASSGRGFKCSGQDAAAALYGVGVLGWAQVKKFNHIMYSFFRG